MYRTSCTTQSSCPPADSTMNFKYVFNNQPSLNRCKDFECNAGYYKNTNNYNQIMCNSATTVGLLQYGIADMTMCTNSLRNVCKPRTVCGPGTTILRNMNGDPIVEIVPEKAGDVQCTACEWCPRGTYRYQACTNTSYQICVKCPWDGVNNYYEINGKCVKDTIAGFYPYQLTYTRSYMQTASYDFIPWPTQILNVDGSIASLPTNTDLVLNFLMPCAQPPEGYEFRNWSTMPPVRYVTINQASQFDLASPVSCNIFDSTQCKKYNSSSKQGWFKNTSNLCQPCTKSAVGYQTCPWYQFGDLETCNGLQDTQCSQCRGNLSPNSLYTTTPSPFFHDSTVNKPCNYDCMVGYFKNADGLCQNCTNKPANSNYAVGPFRLDDTEIDGKYFRTATDWKYFGGTLAKGCNWECVTNYRKTEIYGSSPKQWYCEPCPVNVCLPGEKLEKQITGCEECVQCPGKIMNASYTNGCDQVCNTGFFRKNATFCQKCTLSNCSFGYFNSGCSGSNDYFCTQCSNCSRGAIVSTACNNTMDTVCRNCTLPLIPNGMYNSSCGVVCQTGYVMDNNTCYKCAVTNADCPGGKYRIGACDSVKKGCEDCSVACAAGQTWPCPASTAYNYCWDDAGLCTWKCLKGYSKSWDYKCMSDVFVTTNPVCISPFILPPATSTTPIIVTNTTKAITTTTSRAFTTTTSRAFTNTSQVFTNTTTKLITTTPPPVQINDTVRLEIDVENLDVTTCLCMFTYAEVELTKVLLTPAHMIACGKIQCYNFTCLCPDLNATFQNISNKTLNRRLLQEPETVTTVQFVYQDNNLPISDEDLNNAMKRAFNNQTSVKRVNRQKLKMKGIFWDIDKLFEKFLQALEENSMLFIIVGAAGGFFVIILIVIFVLVFHVYKKEIFGEQATTISTVKPIKTELKKLEKKLTLNLKLINSNEKFQ